MSSARTAKRVFFGSGGNIAGTIYGTIVVMAVIAAGSRGDDTDPWKLAGFVAGTVLALWVAHFYSHALSDSLETKRRLSPVALVRLAGREASVPLAAVAPVIALTLGALEVISEQSAIRLALGIGVATLAALGLRYSRVEQLGSIATLVAVALNVALGLVIVALELTLAH
jgi:hypothetical protein